MYTIYKVTNKINGKIYIGQTTRDLKTRLSSHSTDKWSSLYGPIKEFGQNNFIIEAIDFASNKKEALEKEESLIHFFDSENHSVGYNKSPLFKHLPEKEGKVKLLEDETKTMRTFNVEPLRSLEEIEEMKKALFELGGARDKFLFTLGINTGLRISDIVPLRVGDVRGKLYLDLSEKKTAKKRRVHLYALQGDILEYCDGMADDEFLFPSRNGGHISTTQAYRILVKAGDWIGRNDIGTHTMRKTFGLHYYRRTKDVATLMEIFNHSAPSVTKRYIGIRDEEIAESLKDFKL